MTKLEIGWDDGFGEKMDNTGYGVFGDSLIDATEMQDKYRVVDEIDCGEIGDKVVLANGDISIIVDDERIDYGTDRFDKWTQEELDRLPSLHSVVM